MGEIAAIALKLGVKALPLVLAEWGPFAAFFAFFAFMPLGHLTIGILLVISGLFCPVIPAHDQQHEVHVGSGKAQLHLKGSARTVLIGIGALVVAGSFAESVMR